MCRNGVKKASAHLELNLVVDMKGNKKDFYSYISSKSQMRERGAHYCSNLVIQAMEKPKLHNVVFTSVYT